MSFIFSKKMSRLKKKLLLYFLLIAIVSISVSAEIILEISSSSFKDNILNSFYTQIEKSITKDEISLVKSKINKEELFESVTNFRNRMILFLIVVSIAIIYAFYYFAKDIVSPMDGIVEATQKIVDGDLTVTVPVMSEDEIGQIAGLVNDMNINLQKMIVQLKQEINRYKAQVSVATEKISEIIENNKSDQIITEKKMQISDYKKILKLGKEVTSLLGTMTVDFSSLQTFISMYKTYNIPSEITQDEIENAIKGYSENNSNNIGD